MTSLKIRPLGPSFLLLFIVLAAELFALPSARAAEPAYISLNAGLIELFDPDTRAQVGAEVRFSSHRFRWLPGFIPELSPVAGGLFANKGTLYVYGGFRCDLPLGGGAWALSPQFAAGVYSRERGIDLGGPLEFRSGLELSRSLHGGRARAGLLLYHLSNAGFYEHNPGTEGLVLTYSVRP
jgi:lipid A 3-O-deacylase